MQSLSVSPQFETPTNTHLWTAALLHALARDETAGRRALRLTEPHLRTWARFRGRLTDTDFVNILFEDGKLIHRAPFDPMLVGGEVDPGKLDEALAKKWIAQVSAGSFAEGSVEYVAEQAKLVGLNARLARSALPESVRTHHQVLELPGTGGQLAHHMMQGQPALSLQTNFTIACVSWAEITLAGIIALECGAPDSAFIHRVAASDLQQREHPLRERNFDFVVGLQPSKGGLFEVEEQLALWFPSAKVVLV